MRSLCLFARRARAGSVFFEGKHECGRLCILTDARVLHNKCGGAVYKHAYSCEVNRRFGGHVTLSCLISVVADARV